MTITPTTEAPLTVSELGKKIAAEIRRRGHYQGLGTQDETGEKACVVANSFFPSGNELSPLRIDFLTALREQAGITKPDSETAGMSGDVVSWNDRTPTEEVLAVLENL